jgi:hypothetical protein
MELPLFFILGLAHALHWFQNSAVERKLGHSKETLQNKMYLEITEVVCQRI